MQLCEQETLIVLNEQDKRDGWVRLSTSRRDVAESILKYLEGKATVVLEAYDKFGEITETALRIPANLVRHPKFLFKRPSTIEKKALATELQRGREGFKSKKCPAACTEGK